MHVQIQKHICTLVVVLSTVPHLLLQREASLMKSETRLTCGHKDKYLDCY